jgi:hypothetical protein
VIALTYLLTHPLTIREVALTAASHSKDERDRKLVACPARSIRYKVGYAISSSTSWSYRSSTLGPMRPVLVAQRR